MWKIVILNAFLFILHLESFTLSYLKYFCSTAISSKFHFPKNCQIYFSDAEPKPLLHLVSLRLNNTSDNPLQAPIKELPKNSFIFLTLVICHSLFEDTFTWNVVLVTSLQTINLKCFPTNWLIYCHINPLYEVLNHNKHLVS